MGGKVQADARSTITYGTVRSAIVRNRSVIGKKSISAKSNKTENPFVPRLKAQYRMQLAAIESKSCKSVRKWKDRKTTEQIIKELAENALLAAKAAKIPPASPDPKPANKATPVDQTVLGKHPPPSSKSPPPQAKKVATCPPAAADKAPPAAASKSSSPKQDAVLKTPPPPAAGTTEGDSKPSAKSVVSTRTRSSAFKRTTRSPLRDGYLARRACVGSVEF